MIEHGLTLHPVSTLDVSGGRRGEKWNFVERGRHTPEQGFEVEET